MCVHVRVGVGLGGWGGGRASDSAQPAAAGELRRLRSRPSSLAPKETAADSAAKAARGPAVREQGAGSESRVAGGNRKEVEEQQDVGGGEEDEGKGAAEVGRDVESRSPLSSIYLKSLGADKASRFR